MKVLVALATSLMCMASMTVSALADNHQPTTGTMPQRYSRLLDKMTGQWDAQITSEGEQPRNAEFFVEWAAEKSILRLRWSGTDRDTGQKEFAAGLLGWSQDKQQLVEQAMDNLGTWNTAYHTITEEGDWTSPMHGTTLLDGEPVFFTEHRNVEVKSDDEWVVTVTNSVVDGKPRPERKITMRRKK